MLLRSIRHCLSNLAQFSGRDTRSQFWPYAGVVFALTWFAMGVAVARGTTAMQAFALQHPEQARIETGPGYFSVWIGGQAPELIPPVLQMLHLVAIIAALGILLLAGAVVRRLHDRDKSDLWALPPLLFMAIGFALMPRLAQTIMSGGEPDSSLSLGVFLNNIAYMATLILLIVLLAMKGARGPNRYGPEPEGKAP